MKGVVMKARMLLIGLVFGVGLFVSGCQNYDVYFNPDSGDIASIAEYNQMEPEQQKNYFPGKASGISEKAITQADDVIESAKGVYQITSSWLPEPYKSLLFSLLYGGSVVWGGLKYRKIKDALTGIVLGAEITKQTINEIVRPAISDFDDKLKEKASNSNAILPDDVDKELSEKGIKIKKPVKNS